MKIIQIVFTCLILFVTNASSQMQTANWAFGDSAGISFVSGMPIVDTSFVLSSGESCATISDSLGNLLFYVGSENAYTASFWLHAIWNANHNIMPNGDSILGFSTISQGSIIIPKPSDPTKYYVFTIHRNSGFNSLYHSIVDMTLDGGFGDVSIKNNLVNINGNTVAEQMAAVKHGNGRDWWLIVHREESSEFYKYLITDTGISGPLVQSIGTVLQGIQGQGSMKVSEDGRRLCLVSKRGVIDLYDFDRCSGSLSNWKYLGDSLLILSGDDGMYSCSFSPNNSVLYASSHDSLYQFDLNAINIRGSKTLIYSPVCQDTCWLGQHLLGLDGKIYIANFSGPFYYLHNVIENSNLSQIETPNTVGTGCGFIYLDYNLGGKRSLAGLPNLPNYNLGALIGSPCDSLTSITEVPGYDNALIAYPNPFSTDVTINIPRFKKSAQISIYNMLGDAVQNLQVYQQENILSLHSFAPGIYYIQALSNGNVYNCKLVKQE